MAYPIVCTDCPSTRCRDLWYFNFERWNCARHLPDIHQLKPVLRLSRREFHFHFLWYVNESKSGRGRGKQLGLGAMLAPFLLAKWMLWSPVKFPDLADRRAMLLWDGIQAGTKNSEIRGMVCWQLRKRLGGQFVKRWRKNGWVKWLTLDSNPTYDRGKGRCNLAAGICWWKTGKEDGSFGN